LIENILERSLWYYLFPAECPHNAMPREALCQLPTKKVRSVDNFFRKGNWEIQSTQPPGKHHNDYRTTVSPSHRGSKFFEVRHLPVESWVFIRITRLYQTPICGCGQRSSRRYHVKLSQSREKLKNIVNVREFTLYFN